MPRFTAGYFFVPIFCPSYLRSSHGVGWGNGMGMTWAWAWLLITVIGQGYGDGVGDIDTTWGLW